MRVIGLTGGSGCGKSAFARSFCQGGIAYFDADAAYHQITGAPSPCTREIACAFGTSVLHPDGSLDRRALAEQVFSDAENAASRRAQLNAITHRYVKEACDSAIQSAKDRGEQGILLDVPLLFEAGWDELCFAVLAVVAPFALRCRRIVQRDGLTEEEAARRIAAQPPDSFYRSRTPYIVENAGYIDALVAAANAWREKFFPAVAHGT